MPAELVFASGGARRATAQVRRALTNGEVEALDERRVQVLGILRRQQRVLQPPRGTDLHAPLDADDPIVPTSLDLLTVDASGTSEAQDRRAVVGEAVGRDQRDSDEASAEDNAVESRRGISIGAATEHATGPQAGTHLDGRKQPQGSALAADERAEFINLKLNDVEIAQHAPVEVLCRCRGPLEPLRDGIAGMARDPGGRRNAHALDSQARDLVELPSSAAKTAVCGPRVRAERFPARVAAVPPPSARLRHKTSRGPRC